MAKKIIVIGSGFGGIEYALRMRVKGYNITLYEKKIYRYAPILPLGFFVVYTTYKLKY